METLRFMPSSLTAPQLSVQTLSLANQLALHETRSFFPKALSHEASLLRHGSSLSGRTKIPNHPQIQQSWPAPMYRF